MKSDLQEFRETQASGGFALQSSKMLRASLDQVTIQARLGSMVAYQGDVRFEHAGAGGLGRMFKKAATGEGTQLMKISGTGQVFLADQAQDLHLITLENEQVTCNGASLLAFEAGIDWDIQRAAGGMAGAMAGGLYNVALSGTGQVALISDGPPVMLNTAESPTFADPQAAICWSSGVQTQVKADVNLKTLIGRGSGETVQIGFVGAGWVLVQPSEGKVTPTASSAGGGGGGLLGKLGG